MFETIPNFNFFFWFFNSSPQQLIKLRSMKAKKMTDSLTPWQYEPEQQDRPLSPKRLPLPFRQQSMHRYNSEGGRLRIRTSQKTRSTTRDVIKLQQRAPTESVTLPDWQVEIKAMGFLRNEIVIKIPNQFVTLPPKRQADLSKKFSKSHSRNQAEPAVREKVSFRNFKKEIEELDRLRTGNKAKFDVVNPCKGRGIMKISEPLQSRSSFKTFKRCSLQNMNPFDDPPSFHPQRQSIKTRLPENQVKKKHVLDELLSKFQ